jgi:hypothetical protein
MSGRKRPYDDAELALFAEYRGARARVAPNACTHEPQCWVDSGPPCYDRRTGYTDGRCKGCGGTPNLRADIWR